MLLSFAEVHCCRSPRALLPFAKVRCCPLPRHAAIVCKGLLLSFAKQDALLHIPASQTCAPLPRKLLHMLLREMLHFEMMHLNGMPPSAGAGRLRQAWPC